MVVTSKLTPWVVSVKLLNVVESSQSPSILLSSTLNAIFGVATVLPMTCSLRNLVTWTRSFSPSFFSSADTLVRALSAAQASAAIVLHRSISFL